ncbi:DEAD/DEAH box helicase, partial [Desulfonatronospira sp.]|uniref:DEAD/DEAH box helicase n=1 Tax=Desulfonatronospira sp. TaxID=1962951 RepID=UPI0025C02302
HQKKAVESILDNVPTVISAGTGSGKTECFLIPVLEHCLTSKDPGVKALLLYPMNALANDQMQRIAQLCRDTDVSYGLLTGATPEEPLPEKSIEDANRKYSRREITKSPPDILLTNYVMLERVLTTGKWHSLVESFAHSLKYVVLDELHTYQGSKAAHIMLLLRRLQRRLSGKALLIGSSATLSSPGRDSVDGQEREKELHDYVCTIFSVTRCNIITPEPEPPSSEIPIEWPRKPEPDPELFSRPVSRKSLATMLKDLCGISLDGHEDLDSQVSDSSHPVERIARHPFIMALAQNLRDNGAMKLAEITRIYRDICPYRLTSHEATEHVRAWLSLINCMNSFRLKKPILDLRLHMFMRALAGHLFFCLSCETYHPEGSGVCPDCSLPLFPSDKRNIHCCLAIAESGRLHPLELQDFYEDSVCVQIRRYTPELEHETGILRCRIDFSAKNNDFTDSLVFYQDAHGDYCLVLQEDRDKTSLNRLFVNLTERHKANDYLRSLIYRVLQYLPENKRKLLAFIDDREGVSHNSSILRDEFAADFLEQLLVNLYPDATAQCSILQALNTLCLYSASPGSESVFTVQELEILDEVELWFLRFIKKPQDTSQGKKDFLMLRTVSSLSPVEQKILNVFLKERAIELFDIKAWKDSSYIKYNRHWAIRKRRIYLDAEQAPVSERITGISLSQYSRNHHAFLADLGRSVPADADSHLSVSEAARAGADIVTKIISSLVEKGIVREFSDDGRNSYALNPEYVVFSPEWINSKRTRAGSDPRAIIVRYHSSELETQKRAEVENQFRKGDVDFLLATPTLEMGIDIGSLQSILLVGVPPCAANYAQRAGRAGRRGQLSLTICYCRDHLPHDVFYFHRPAEMINGLINPPTIHRPSSRLLLKHVRAEMLSGYADGTGSMQEFAAMDQDLILQRLDGLSSVVDKNKMSFVEDYARNHFTDECREIFEKSRSFNLNPLNLMYQTGFLPDYGFHRDNVRVYEYDHYQKLAGSGRLSPMNRDHISEREPEQAVSKFAPGRTGYLAGDVYRFETTGRYQEWSIEAQTGRIEPPVRSYSIVTASKPEQVHKDNDPPIYLLNTMYNVSTSWKEFGNILQVTRDPQAKIAFMNFGCLNSQETVFKDKNGEFYLGYHLVRDALVMKIPREIFYSFELPISLLSALDRTIKNRYRLNDSEITSVTGLLPWQDLYTPFKKISHHHLAIYDSTGNSDLPLDKVAAEIEKVFIEAYARLRDCNYCIKNLTDGCYDCLKSFYTRHLARFASRGTAMNILGYLAGKDRLTPDIQPYKKSGGANGADIDVRWKNRLLTISSAGKEPLTCGSCDAVTVYQSLAGAIQSWFPSGGQNLVITTNLDFLVKNINRQTQARTAGWELGRLRFELLRFDTVNIKQG